jgi:hypothetical protein
MSDLELAAAVAGIVSGVLGLRPDTPEPHRTVVELGANSLDANRITARIAAEFGVRVRVGTVLSATVTELADNVERMLRERPARDGARAEAAAGDGAEALLTPAQTGIWIAQRMERDPVMYVEPVLVRLQPAISRDRAVETIRLVTTLHPALLGRVRTSPVSAPVLDESGSEPEILLRPAGASHELVAELEQTPLDVTMGPLSRFILFGDDDRIDELAVVVHHLVCDGAGLHRLLDDLWCLVAGRAPAPPGRLRFSDFLRLKRAAPADPARVERLARRLEMRLPGAEPTRHSAHPSGTAGTWCRRPIDGPLSSAIRAAAGRAGCTTFAVVAAAFAAAIGDRYGVREVPLCVGASEQYDYPQFAGVVGHYVNLVPVPVYAGREDLAGAAGAIAGAQADRDVHVSEVMAAMLGQGRGMGALVRFVVTTGRSYQDLARPPFAAVRALDTGHAKVPALLTLVEDRNGRSAAVELSARTSDLPSDGAVRLLDDLRGHLRRLASS